jgi:hypothetical protein
MVEPSVTPPPPAEPSGIWENILDLSSPLRETLVEGVRAVGGLWNPRWTLWQEIKRRLEAKREALKG